MNKSKKALKALLVFGMSIATATSLVSVTACNDEENTTKHEHKYEWVTTDANQHWKECTAEGHEGDKIDPDNKKTAHTYDNDQDTTCNDCGHVREVTTTPAHTHTWEWVTTDATKHWKECTAEGHEGDKKDPATEAAHVYDNDQDPNCNDCGHVREVTPPAPVTKEDVVVNIASHASTTMANATVLGEGIELVVLEGKDAPVVGSSGGKKPLVKGEEVTDATHRLQLKSKTNNGLKVTPTADATLVIYANSNGADVRNIGLYTELTSTAEVAQEQGIGVNGNDLDCVMFNLSAGQTYYVGVSNTVNIFYMILAYNDLGETAEHVEAKTANCTEAGNIDYYKTNYGRYYTLSGETKTYVPVATIVSGNTTALGHSYAVDGTVTQPTQTAKGSVTLKCGRDNSHTVVKELPVLTSEDYTRTVNAEDNTKYDYKITLEGVDVTFTAAKVEVVEATWTSVYTSAFVNDSEDSIAFGKDNATLEGGAKVYGLTNDSTVTEWNTNYNAQLTAGGLKITDTGNKSAIVNVELGTALNSGVVKIEGSITANAVGSKWNLMSLVDATGEGEVVFAALRSNANKKLCLGTDNTNDNLSTTEVAFSAKTEYAFEIVIDFDNNTVTMTIGTTELCKDLSLDLTGKSLSAIQFKTADSATDRHLTVGSLKISTKD